METYDYDEAATPGFGPEGNVTPSLPDNNDVPATPGPGPEGNVTPSLPGSGNGNSGNSNRPATPGFGPAGPVTPTLPSGGTSGCINCTGGQTVIRPGNNVLWTWGILSPFFSTSSTIAHVRFYNAAASREPLDIYLNGRLVVSNLDFMNFTNFLHIVPGVYRLTIYSRTNPNAPIIDTGVQFRGGTSYTLTVLGTPNNYSVQLMTS